MRNAFASEITSIAGEDESVVLLSGDIGNRLFDGFKERFRNRFFNCGVAEANMTGIAAGMAACGLRPVTYTITPFNTIRCLEQIKIDICYNHLPVVIVGVGSGLSYASLGPTHHSLDDIAFMRLLPNMTVICPGDAYEVRQALRKALCHTGPVYIRLGKKNEPLVHEQTPSFEIGKGIVVRSGKDVCLLSTGNMLPIAVQAAEDLAGQNISAQVVSFHTVKPLDEKLLDDVFTLFPLVATIEEHSVLAGFGGAVAEWLTDHTPKRSHLLRFATSDEFYRDPGNQNYARQQFELSSECISKKILDLVKSEGLLK